MASLYEDYDNLLAEGSPKGNADAEKWSSYDPLGDEIFGWGNASKNREIRNRIAAIEEMQGRISAEQRRRLEETLGANEADWTRLTTDILGADGQKLNQFYERMQQQDQANYDQLEQGLGGYQSLESLFNDPNFYGDVGDITNAAFPTDATVASQRGALAKMQALSDPTESASERFMRLQAQQEAEANMKGSRDAIARDLKARGAYGSGAEVAQNMMAQADAANRRYMANMGANAAASQRATQMLGMGADLASKMRASETQEGALANQAAMFNNQMNQNLMNQRSKSLQEGRAADNTRGDWRAKTMYGAGRDLTESERRDLQNRIGTQTSLTQGTINTRTGAQQARDAADDELIQRGKTRQAALTGEIEEPLIGGGMW